MYGMFLYGQYDVCTPSTPEIVEKIVYVGGGGGAERPRITEPTIRVRLLRKEEEKFNVIVKSIEEF